jgi:hypothetical protein
VIGFDGVRPISLTIAALVWGDHMVAFRRQCRQLMSPRVPQFWKPMAEDDQRPLALLRDVHVDAVGVDEPMVHGRHTLSFRLM